MKAVREQIRDTGQVGGSNEFPKVEAGDATGWAATLADMGKMAREALARGPHKSAAPIARPDTHCETCGHPRLDSGLLACSCLLSIAPAQGVARSMTYGDLVQKSPLLATKIQPHEWDNMNISEQLDWVVSQFAAPIAPAAVAEPKVTEQDVTEAIEMMQDDFRASELSVYLAARRELDSAQQHIANLESELQIARDLIQQMRQQLSAANLGSAMQHERYGSY